MPEVKKTADTAKKAKPAKAAKVVAAPKKPAAPKKATVKKDVEISVIVEHHGRQIGVEAIAETAKKLWVLAGHDAADAARVELYVKQEDGAVYCVVNGEAVGRYDL